MKRRNLAQRPGCAVETTLDLFDGKWKRVILFHLQGGGTQRFGEFRALEQNRLIIRKVYPRCRRGANTRCPRFARACVP